MEGTPALTSWPERIGDDSGQVPSGNSRFARGHRFSNTSNRTEQRRMYSADHTTLSASKPIRSIKSANPASQTPRTLSHLIVESTEGQPLEVRDILNSPFQRTGPALVTGLKQQTIRATEERDALAWELDRLRRSTRATRVSEMEMEVRIYKEQLTQSAQLQEALIHKMEASEARAREAEARSQATTAALQGYLAHQGYPGALPAAVTTQPPSKSLSGRSKTRTLGALRSAHDTMIGQAALLRRAFGGLKLKSVDEVAVIASANPEVSAAADVLRYLLVHLSGLAQELRQLPGASDIMRGPMLFPAPNYQGMNSIGVSTSVDTGTSGIKGGKHSGAGSGSREKRYVYPLPGPLPRQISSSGDLVLGLMDQLYDLKQLSRSEQCRSHEVHPTFLHDIETMTSLSAELSRELSRLKGSSSNAGGRSEQQRLHSARAEAAEAYSTPACDTRSDSGPAGAHAAPVYVAPSESDYWVSEEHSGEWRGTAKSSGDGQSEQRQAPNGTPESTGAGQPQPQLYPAACAEATEQPTGLSARSPCDAGRQGSLGQGAPQHWQKEHPGVSEPRGEFDEEDVSL